MSKNSVKSNRKQRNSKWKPYGRDTDSVHVEKNEVNQTSEKLCELQTLHHSTPTTPTTLDADISAVSRSMVNVPLILQSTVSGNINISSNYVGKKDVTVTPSTISPNSGTCSAQEASTDQQAVKNGSIFRTPDDPSFRQQQDKCQYFARRKLTFDTVTDETLPSALEDKNKVESGEPELTTITGEIIGTKVITKYQCSKCGCEIPSFKTDLFSVECAHCKHTWKCARLQYTSTAEVTIEKSDGKKLLVVLSDSLLHSIVKFHTKGYCKNDKIVEKILKVGSIKVNFKDGHPDSLEVIKKKM